MKMINKYQRVKIEEIQAKNRNRKNLRCFEAWKKIKKYQKVKMEEIQAKNQNRKNRMVRF
jgi:hypothetical protein